MLYRQATVQKAQEIWAAQPFFLDTETTGLHNTAEIVEIAVIDHAGQVVFETLVRPRRPIPLDAVRIHGITDEAVRTAPTWLQVWPRLETLLRNHYVGAYNAEFDLRMFQQTHQANGLRWNNPSIRFFCVMKMYAEYAGLLKWARLEDAGQQLRIPIPNKHRAVEDTQLARAIFMHMLGS